MNESNKELVHTTILMYFSSEYTFLSDELFQSLQLGFFLVDLNCTLRRLFFIY